jgi:hypothetical protein
LLPPSQSAWRCRLVLGPLVCVAVGAEPGALKGETVVGAAAFSLPPVKQKGAASGLAAVCGVAEACGAAKTGATVVTAVAERFVAAPRRNAASQS